MESKKKSLVLTVAVALVFGAGCSATTFFVTRNHYKNPSSNNIKGDWYSTYAGNTFVLSLSGSECSFGYESQEKVKCTYEYSDEVLKLKTESGTEQLIYSKDKNTLYINSQPYYSTKEESSKNDDYFYVPADYDTSMFTKISATEFVEKYNKGEAMFVLTARGSCAHCQIFRPIAAESVKNYDYTLYYIDIAHVTDKEFEAVKALNTTFANTFGSTPNTYYVKDKKIVDTFEGAGSAEDFGKFLTKNGVKKK